MAKHEDYAFLELNATFYHIYDFSLEKMREAYKEQEGEFGYVLYEGSKRDIGFDTNKICMHSAGVHRHITTLRAINYNIPISIVHENERIVGDTPPEGTIGPVTYKETVMISSSFHAHRKSGTSMESVFMDVHVGTYTTKTEQSKPKKDEEEKEEGGIAGVISRALSNILERLEKEAESKSPAERAMEEVDSFIKFTEKKRKSQANGKSEEEIERHNKELFERITGELTVDGKVMENVTFVNNNDPTSREAERYVFEVNYLDNETPRNLKISLNMPEFMLGTVIQKNTKDVKGMYVTFEDGTREALLFNQIESGDDTATKNRMTASQIGFDLIMNLPPGMMML